MKKIYELKNPLADPDLICREKDGKPLKDIYEEVKVYEPKHISKNNNP